MIGLIHQLVDATALLYFELWECVLGWMGIREFYWLYGGFKMGCKGFPLPITDYGE